MLQLRCKRFTDLSFAPNFAECFSDNGRYDENILLHSVFSWWSSSDAKQWSHQSFMYFRDDLIPHSVSLITFAVEVVFLPGFLFVKDPGIGVSGHFCSFLCLFGRQEGKLFQSRYLFFCSEAARASKCSEVKKIGNRSAKDLEGNSAWSWEGQR